MDLPIMHGERVEYLCERNVFEKKKENGEGEIKSIWSVWVGVLTLDKIVYNCWTANRGWIVETDTDRRKGQTGPARQWDMLILWSDVRNFIYAYRYDVTAQKMLFTMALLSLKAFSHDIVAACAE